MSINKFSKSESQREKPFVKVWIVCVLLFEPTKALDASQCLQPWIGLLSIIPSVVIYNLWMVNTLLRVQESMLFLSQRQMHQKQLLILLEKIHIRKRDSRALVSQNHWNQLVVRSFCKLGHLYLYYAINSHRYLLKVHTAQVSPLNRHRCQNIWFCHWLALLVSLLGSS